MWDHLLQEQAALDSQQAQRAWHYPTTVMDGRVIT